MTDFVTGGVGRDLFIANAGGSWLTRDLLMAIAANETIVDLNA